MGQKIDANPIINHDLNFWTVVQLMALAIVAASVLGCGSSRGGGGKRPSSMRSVWNTPVDAAMLDQNDSDFSIEAQPLAQKPGSYQVTLTLKVDGKDYVHQGELSDNITGVLLAFEGTRKISQVDVDAFDGLRSLIVTQHFPDEDGGDSDVGKLYFFLKSGVQARYAATLKAVPVSRNFSIQVGQLVRDNSRIGINAQQTLRDFGYWLQLDRSLTVDRARATFRENRRQYQNTQRIVSETTVTAVAPAQEPATLPAAAPAPLVRVEPEPTRERDARTIPQPNFETGNVSAPLPMPRPSGQVIEVVPRRRRQGTPRSAGSQVDSRRGQPRQEPSPTPTDTTSFAPFEFLTAEAISSGLSDRRDGQVREHFRVQPQGNVVSDLAPTSFEVSCAYSSANRVVGAGEHYFRPIHLCVSTYPNVRTVIVNKAISLVAESGVFDRSFGSTPNFEGARLRMTFNFGTPHSPVTDAQLMTAEGSFIAGGGAAEGSRALTLIFDNPLGQTWQRAILTCQWRRFEKSDCDL